MKYQVIPFVPQLDHKNPSGGAAAAQLDALINKQAADGWTYVRLESVTAWVAGDSGCFGFGAKPSQIVSRQMIVFTRDH